MTEKEKKCNTCKRAVSNNPGSVNFKCPNCGKTDIVRCKHCRSISAAYKCPECGFGGPN